jgi:hypothetical protein
MSNPRSSSTSLLGMALLRCESTLSDGNYHCQQEQKLAVKRSLDEGVLCESHENAAAAQFLRVKSNESLPSIGLDMGPYSSRQVESQGTDMEATKNVADRDLRTPTAMCVAPGVTTPPAGVVQNCQESPNEKNDSSSSALARSLGSTSVFLSRSDPDNVQLTIARMAMAEGYQNSPPMTCKG